MQGLGSFNPLFPIFTPLDCGVASMVCIQGQRANLWFLPSKLERSYIRKSLSSHCRFVIFPRNQLKILQTAPFVNRHPPPHAILLPVQCIESAQMALKLPHTRISSQSSTSYLLKVFFRISQHFVLRVVKYLTFS